MSFNMSIQICNLYTYTTHIEYMQMYDNEIFLCDAKIFNKKIFHKIFKNNILK